MKPIDQALQTLLQREPTPEEVAKFYKIKEICGFSEHDSVWAILLAFGHFEILYGDIPDKIAEQARQLLADHKLALEASADAAERAVRGSLIEQVTKTARELAERSMEAGKILANQQSRRKFLLGVGFAMAIAVPSIGALVFGAYHAGMRAQTSIATLDSAWVQSPEGRAARALAQLNNVDAMLACRSYQVRKEANATYCVPYDERANRSFGWRIK